MSASDGETTLRQAGHLAIGAAVASCLDPATVAAFGSSAEPILIMGERGTGKTSLAGHLHALSRRTGNLVVYSLSATDDSLNLSQLFGHARGAFTGALESRLGYVETARDGTLFIDELAVASSTIQRHLLTLFDKQGYRRIGEDRLRPITARIIGATNRNLITMAEAGEFRHDLLDRFGYMRITLPPLRERRAEVLPLFRAFLAGSLSRLDRRWTVEPSVEGALLAAPWAGNIRELEHVAGYAAAMTPAGHPVGVAHLPPAFLATLGPEPGPIGRTTTERIRDALDRFGGNKAAAARALQLSRRTVQRHAANDDPV